ncbi:MAG: N-acetylmuramoyl-L-alanine amidase [Chthoniobacteraceae bacterium]
MRFRVIFSLVIFAACVSAAFGGDWTLVKYQGRDHVTLENVAHFYNLDTVHRASNDVTMTGGARSLRGAVGSNELYINNLKFILSYPISEVDGHLILSRMDLTKVIEPVMRPSKIKGAEQVNTIILDPGHGGHDNGATSVWGNEKTYTLDVAMRTKEALEQMGFKVYMTRSSDEFIPLEDRVRFANQFTNALFISIHFNFGGSSASGLETYTLAPRGVPSMAADGPMLSDYEPCPGNVCDAENMALATATHASLVYHSQLYDRGIKRARFVVIRDIKIPGVLVEGGFLSNPDDSRKIASTAYRQQMAMSIANAARSYRTAVGTSVPSNLIAGRNGSNVSPVGESTDSSTDGGHAKANEPIVVTSPTAN